MEERLMQAMLALDEQHWWYRGRRAIIAAELDRLELPGGDVLDAGCGSGRTLVELARLGRPVCGIEPHAAAVALAQARGGFDVRRGRIEELPWSEDTFGLVTCLDVLEHTPDDARALAELRRVTRPGGSLLLTVPAYPALWSSHDVVNHHFRRYTRASLHHAAQMAGWEVARITSFNTVLLAPAALIRLAGRAASRTATQRTELDLGPLWLNRLLERPLRAEARWLAGGRTLPAGLSLLALLRA